MTRPNGFKNCENTNKMKRKRIKIKCNMSNRTKTYFSNFARDFVYGNSTRSRIGSYGISCGSGPEASISAVPGLGGFTPPPCPASISATNFFSSEGPNSDRPAVVPLPDDPGTGSAGFPAFRRGGAPASAAMAIGRSSGSTAGGDARRRRLKKTGRPMARRRRGTPIPTPRPIPRPRWELELELESAAEDPVARADVVI